MVRPEAVKPPPGFKCKNFFSKAIPEGAILEPKISKNPVGRPKKALVRAPSDSNPDPNDDQSQLGQAATSATQSAAQSDNTVAQADRELPPAPTSQQASKRVQEQQETGQHLRKRAKRDHDAPYMKWFVSVPSGTDAKGKPVRFVKCVACSDISGKDTIIVDNMDTLQKHLGIKILGDDSIVHSTRDTVHDRCAERFEELAQRRELGACSSVQFLSPLQFVRLAVWISIAASLTCNSFACRSECRPHMFVV